MYKGFSISMAANWKKAVCGDSAAPVYGFDTFTGQQPSNLQLNISAFLFCLSLCLGSCLLPALSVNVGVSGNESCISFCCIVWVPVQHPFFFVILKSSSAA